MGLALALGAVPLVAWNPAESSEFANIDRATEEYLGHIVIPRLEFRDTSLEEAVEYLNRVARENGSTIQISIWDSPELPKGFRPLLPRTIIVPAIPGRDGSTVSEVKTVETLPTEALVTVTLTNIPLSEALRYVGGLSNSARFIYTRKIYFLPGHEGTFDPLVTCTYGFAYLASLPAQSLSAREYLESQGVSFYEGCAATYSGDRRKITVTNTENSLCLIDVPCVSPMYRERCWRERCQERLRDYCNFLRSAFEYRESLRVYGREKRIYHANSIVVLPVI